MLGSSWLIGRAYPLALFVTGVDQIDPEDVGNEVFGRIDGNRFEQALVQGESHQHERCISQVLAHFSNAAPALATHIMLNE